MEKQPKFDYSDIKFKDNGKLKLIIVVGTRPEIIRHPPVTHTHWRLSSPNVVSISM